MEKIKTENGLRIITVPSKNTKVATVLVLVKTGSKNEEKEISGISHFLEHMFFKGTRRRKTPLKIAEVLDKIGGSYNAFTGTDYTGYYAKVNATQISLAIDWVADIYLNSTLPEKEIEKERGVIKEEINMYYDNPMAYCQILFQKLLYGDQPAGWDIAGTKETVSSISREDLSHYMNAQYVSGNTIVVVSGNIDKTKIEKEVAKAFSKIRKGKGKEKATVVEKQEKPQTLNFYKETDQTHFCLGVRSFSMFHPHRYTQEVMAALLGGMMSSRLFVKVRDELGLAYYVRTSVDENPDTGVLVTQAGVDNKKVKDAISAVIKEYNRLKKEAVSPAELKKTKEHLKGRAAIMLEPSDAVARFYGISELLEGKTYKIEDVFKEIDSVSINDLQSIAHQIFKPENLNLAIVGPHKDKKQIEGVMDI